MHDLDRTRLEAEQDFFGEANVRQEADYEQYSTGEYEEYEAERSLDEVGEMELAAELLEVTNEAELEQFLGNLFSKVASATGRLLGSDTGSALGGLLKNAAGYVSRALPSVGRAVGQWVAPGIGGDIGAQLASQAGPLFGLELEGLSGEDREFEAARQFVRFAADATKEAAAARATSDPAAAAQTGVTVAAQRFAPGLLAGPAASAFGVGLATTGPRRTGRWFRLPDGKIVLTGV